jgi:2-polyprenyl-3-methyl-5-hydroxy-6-metoxy-1,4-benzoquinol methylase
MAKAANDWRWHRLFPDREFLELDQKDHIARYIFAAGYVEGGGILDLGCGAGYGLDFLSRRSASAVGVDISSSALIFAKRSYKGNFEISLQDASSLGFRDDTFDIVVSFEVIEHLRRVQSYLSDVRRVLKPGGLFIVSTPNKTLMSPGRKSPIRKWHKREFYYHEFEALLKHYFVGVYVLGERVSDPFWQNRLRRIGKLHKYLSIVPTNVLRLVPMSIVTAITGPPPPVRLEDVQISRENVETAETFVGVARKAMRS